MARLAQAEATRRTRAEERAAAAAQADVQDAKDLNSWAHVASRHGRAHERDAKRRSLSERSNHNTPPKDPKHTQNQTQPPANAEPCTHAAPGDVCALCRPDQNQPANPLGGEQDLTSQHETQAPQLPNQPPLDANMDHKSLGQAQLRCNHAQPIPGDVCLICPVSNQGMLATPSRDVPQVPIQQATEPGHTPAPASTSSTKPKRRREQDRKSTSSSSSSSKQKLEDERSKSPLPSSTHPGAWSSSRGQCILDSATGTAAQR